MKRVYRYKSEYKSYYCYPNSNTLDYIPEFINNIGEEKLRQVLSLITCCGYRIGEALNSYVYMNDGKLIVQAPMEKKKRRTKHVMPEHGFLGERYLNAKLKDNNLWKSNELKHIFPDVKMGWLDGYLSEDRLKPNWIFSEGWNSYKMFYAELHKYPPFEVKYILSEYQIPTTIEHIPSYHFFRKSFCAQAIRTKTFRNIVELTKYIGWERLDMAMFYVKDYGEGNEKEALDLFNSSKFHYED